MAGPVSGPMSVPVPAWIPDCSYLLTSTSTLNTHTTIILWIIKLLNYIESLWRKTTIPFHLYSNIRSSTILKEVWGSVRRMLFSSKLQHYWPCMWIIMKKFENLEIFNHGRKRLRLNCCKYSIFLKICGSFLEDWNWHRIKVAFVSENIFYHTWTQTEIPLCESLWKEK